MSCAGVREVTGLWQDPFDGRCDHVGSRVLAPVTLTATVDAYRPDEQVTGVGIVLQANDRPRRRGPIIAEIVERHRGIAPGEIELFAVFRALAIAFERGFCSVKVRSDDNRMRRNLKLDYAAGLDAEPSSLHGRVLALTRWFDSVTFAYVPRRKNGIAHRLARAAAGNGA